MDFKVREDTDTDSQQLTEDIRLELRMPEMQLSCSFALTVTWIWHDACQSVNTFLHIARMTRVELNHCGAKISKVEGEGQNGDKTITFDGSSWQAKLIMTREKQKERKYKTKTTIIG